MNIQMPSLKAFSFQNYSPRYLFRIVPLLILLALSYGCQSYQMGSSIQLPFNSIYIQPVENQSYAPQAQAVVTNNLINAFLRDGQLKVSDRNRADATLVVRLKDYTKDVTATQSSDSGRASTISLNLQASVDLINNRKGTFYFKDRHFSADESIFSQNNTNSNLPQAEYLSMSILASELANKIQEAVTDLW